MVAVAQVRAGGERLGRARDGQLGAAARGCRAAEASGALAAAARACADAKLGRVA